MFNEIIDLMPYEGNATLDAGMNTPQGQIDFLLEHYAQDGGPYRRGIYTTAHILYVHMTIEEMPWATIRAAFETLNHQIETYGKEEW